MGNLWTFSLFVGLMLGTSNTRQTLKWQASRALIVLFINKRKIYKLKGRYSVSISQDEKTESKKNPKNHSCSYLFFFFFYRQKKNSLVEKSKGRSHEEGEST